MLKRIINVFPFKANELTSFMYETGHEKNNAIFEDNKTPKGADGTVFLFFRLFDSLVWFGSLLNVPSTILQSCLDGATTSWVLSSTLGELKVSCSRNTTRRSWGSNPGPLAPESDALPLSHRAFLFNRIIG